MCANTTNTAAGSNKGAKTLQTEEEIVHKEHDDEPQPNDDLKLFFKNYNKVTRITHFIPNGH